MFVLSVFREGEEGICLLIQASRQHQADTGCQGCECILAHASGQGKLLRGFQKEQCVAFHGDAVSHQVSWKDKAELPKGWLRLHFFSKNADLYTFRID